MYLNLSTIYLPPDLCVIFEWLLKIVTQQGKKVFILFCCECVHPSSDVIRWVLNLVVPLMTLFGVLNLVVSGEAIEGVYKFFKNTAPKQTQEQNNDLGHIGRCNSPNNISTRIPLFHSKQNNLILHLKNANLYFNFNANLFN